MKIPESIKKFVDVFSELPGIGPRQAIRLAFYFVGKGKGVQNTTIQAIEAFKNIKICKQCFFIHENENGLCDICGNSNRNRKVIAVVLKETDLVSIENTKNFNGRYLVLGDLRRSGLLGEDQKFRLSEFKSWVNKNLGGKAEEIIIAVNPTTYGDLNASLIAKELQPFANKLSRLGRGIPTGGEIEFADEETLKNALDRRL